MALDWDQTVDLLTVIAGYDRRTVGQEDVTVWMDAVNRIPRVQFGEAVEAVKRHFATSEKWLMPAHVTLLVRAVREDEARRARRESAQRALPPSRPKVPEWFSQWRRDCREGKADPNVPPVPPR